MHTRPPAKIMFGWFALLVTGLYALFGLVVALATVWMPLPDYHTLQEWTIDMEFYFLGGWAVVYLLLAMLPDPEPQRGWKRLRAHLVPWGLFQLALLAYCIFTLVTLPPIEFVGQVAYQTVVLRAGALFPVAVALGVAPMIYRRLASLWRSRGG